MFWRLFILVPLLFGAGAAAADARGAKINALAVQVALDKAGFSPGVIDGTMGGLTQQALRGFQEAKGLKVTGEADAETLAALGGQSKAVEKVTVTEADAA